MEIATPDARGNRHKPLIWQRIPVNLINKKKATLVIFMNLDWEKNNLRIRSRFALHVMNPMIPLFP